MMDLAGHNPAPLLIFSLMSKTDDQVVVRSLLANPVDAPGRT